jgi:hypothetical protein
MAGFLLWLLLLVFCWPLALLALVLYPIVWLLLLPLRLVGITVGAGFAFLGALLMLTPLEFDVTGTWPAKSFDAIFSANTLHIMAWPEVQQLFARLPTISTDDTRLIIYGPFNDGGRYSSDSNAAFDQSLKARGAHMGIRDAEAIDALASEAGFHLLDDIAMPANNRCRVWRHRAA